MYRSTLKRCSFFLLSIFFFNTGYFFGQEENKNSYKNEAGLDLIDLFDGTIQLSYERKLKGNFSVALGLGLKGKNGIINLSGIDNYSIQTNDITYSGFKIIPEIRYYINKTQRYTMDGFYVGAYFKYSNYKSDITGSFTSQNNKVFNLAFDAKFQAASAGFLIGYKLPIAKRISVDFLIAGPGIANHSYKFSNKEELPEEFYANLNNALDNYNYFKNVDVDFKFSEQNKKFDFLFPAFRYGISCGYIF